MMGGKSDDGKGEHGVREHGAAAATEHLGRKIGEGALPGRLMNQDIDDGDQRIEMCAGHWSEQSDENVEASRGSPGILQELEPYLSGRELLSSNT